MKKEYEAFNGLFKFKIATGPDAEELSDEELEELEDELEDLKERIERGKRKSYLPKASEDDKKALSNDDVPYEVRMKYIIDAYKKDQEKWAKLAGYAKHLEGEVIRLKKILIENGYTDSGASEDWTPAKEIVDLKKKIKKLEDKIENVYPKKQKHNLKMKKVISRQSSYILQLQSLLEKNGIPYTPPPTFKQITQEDIDAIDENAVR